MNNTKSRLILLGKLVLAFAVLGALLLIAGRDLFPLVAPWRLLLYFAVGVLIFLVVVGLQAYIGAEWNRCCLNRGATDAAWLWFGAEPPGLEQLREDSDTGMSAPSRWMPLEPRPATVARRYRLHLEGDLPSSDRCHE
ncbi:hypothetical protein J7E62_14765 [Variovorax paradoxus]|nr:hypothetical protein [Variovorax paradoxus]